MKNWLLFFVLLVLIVSCQKDSTSQSPPGPDPLLVKTDSIALTLNGYINSKDSFSITSNTAWIISITPSTATWLTTSSMSGTGNLKIFVTAIAENATAADRIATIVISHSGPSTTQPISITVSQKKLPVLANWSKTFGGTGEDRFLSLTNSADGGYLLVGITKSNDGDVPGNHGMYDAMVIKIDGNGTKQWSRSFGGTGDDFPHSITNTSDGGYLMAGTTYSNDGDMTGNHGGADAWVMKLDAAGNKLWSKVYGGTLYDGLTSIVTTADNMYVLAGTSSSNDGDVSVNHGGGGDAWILKIDAAGGRVWSKVFGGTNSDRALSIIATTDGGYIFSGYAWSNDGDIGGHRGGGDAWVVKIDANASKQWSKTFGGTGIEDDFSIISNSDGGYLLIGRTNSNDGDVSGLRGNYDALIIKLDGNGTKQWSKTYGGIDYDGATTAISTFDGHYLIVGRTQSNDGDVSSQHGETDGWIMRLDASGNISWSKVLGGTRYDATFAMTASTDGASVLAGYSISNDGDVRADHGTFDAWVIKYKP